MKKDHQLDLFYDFKPKAPAKPSNNSQNKKSAHKKKKKKKNTKTHKFVKFIILLGLFIGGILSILLSPLFDIKEITVENNEQIGTEQIVNLSRIEIGNNMFKINKMESIKNIKTNAYIDNVKIKRKLPDKIVLYIEERHATFQVEIGTGYAYMNNQGYILEFSDTKIEVPIIEGITENIEVGNRIIDNDLQKLEQVLKIVKAASSKKIANLISKIDITNKDEYILVLETEGKTAYIGDVSNIDTKMAYIKDCIEREKDKKGKIFVNVDLNKKKDPYFREE